MIVQDEGEILGRALESVKDLADEIVVVDGGSKDNTKEIARKYTDKVYDFPWCDDFSKSRNFSLTKATGDWILVLDADEVIAKEDYDEIRKLVETEEYVGYALKQVNYTNDTTQYSYNPFILTDDVHMKYKSYAKDFTGYIFCNIIRLFRDGVKFKGAVHESVDEGCREKGNVLKTNVWIHHYQFERGVNNLRDKQLKYLRIYEKNIDGYYDKARAYRDMGSICYTHLNEYSKATGFFEKSLSLNNRNKKTYVGLGLCYLKQNKFREALNVFDKGLQIFHNDKQLLHLKKCGESIIERFIKD